MIKISGIDVWGFRHAIRGMRNPMNSWNKSDSKWCDDWDCDPDGTCKMKNVYGCTGSPGDCVIGEADANLMHSLFEAGTEHRKYLRQIFISMDITAPLYWIAEFDTYKIGTTRNSCSFMHKGVSKPFEITDFSIHDDRVYEVLSPINKNGFELGLYDNCKSLHCKYLKWKNGFTVVTPHEKSSIMTDKKNGMKINEIAEKYDITISQANNIISINPCEYNELFLLCHTWETTISLLNDLRELYLETNDPQIFQQIRCILPSGYNQKFTVSMNYENAVSMIRQRKDHKLDEWRVFVKKLMELPHMDIILGRV